MSVLGHSQSEVASWNRGKVASRENTLVNDLRGGAEELEAVEEGSPWKMASWASVGTGIALPPGGRGFYF